MDDLYLNNLARKADENKTQKTHAQTKKRLIFKYKCSFFPVLPRDVNTCFVEVFLGSHKVDMQVIHSGDFFLKVYEEQYE